MSVILTGTKKSCCRQRKVVHGLIKLGRVQNQLEELERKETNTSLQVNRVRITVAAELIHVNRLLKNATDRKPNVIELIHVHRNMGHANCRGQQ